MTEINPKQTNTLEHQADTYIADILHKIQSKQIPVHSKTFFRLKWLAFVVLALAICTVSVALCSFILFTIRMTGQPHLIDFGSKGVELAFIIFPWMLFLIDGLLILLLGALTRHTSFGYKIPGIYILVAVIGIIGVSGYIVETKTSFHKNMLYYADKKQLPFFQSMYTSVRRAPPKGYEIYRGVVIGEGPGFLRIDIDDEEGIGTSTRILVRMSTSTSEVLDIHMGHTVFISGKIINGQIVDARIKRAPRLPPPR